MDVNDVKAAIRKAGYGVAICRVYPRSNWIEVSLDCSSPKKKWFGVLKRKLARQGITVLSHYGATSQYIEYLSIPLPQHTAADTDGRGEA